MVGLRETSSLIWELPEFHRKRCCTECLPIGWNFVIWKSKYEILLFFHIALKWSNSYTWHALYISFYFYTMRQLERLSFSLKKLKVQVLTFTTAVINKKKQYHISQTMIFLHSCALTFEEPRHCLLTPLGASERAVKYASITAFCLLPIRSLLLVSVLLFY